MSIIIKTFETKYTKLKELRKANLILPELSFAVEDFDENETGVAVTSYGQGKVTGALFTVPAHGEITVNFELRLVCITPDDVRILNDFIRSLLDASKQHLYDELEKTTVSGGQASSGYLAGAVRRLPMKKQNIL